jgi:hypothetical protein
VLVSEDSTPDTLINIAQINGAETGAKVWRTNLFLENSMSFKFRLNIAMKISLLVRNEVKQMLLSFLIM